MLKTELSFPKEGQVISLQLIIIPSLEKAWNKGQNLESKAKELLQEVELVEYHHVFLAKGLDLHPRHCK